MLHINTINYEKAYSFSQNSHKIFRKNYRIFTKFSQNFQKIFRKNYEKFQKKLQEISEKITIKPIYIVNILTKNL